MRWIVQRYIYSFVSFGAFAICIIRICKNSNLVDYSFYHVYVGVGCNFRRIDRRTLGYQILVLLREIR